MESKKIGTFKEFLKEQSVKKMFEKLEKWGDSDIQFWENNRVMPLTVLLKKQKTAIGHPIGHIFYYTSIYFFVCAWREQRTGSDVLSIFILEWCSAHIFHKYQCRNNG